MRLISLVAIFFLIACNASSEAKTWRDITPMKSSRADVERILGVPKFSTESSSIHITADGQVVVKYATGPQCPGKSSDEWRVPEGTAISINLDPLKPPTLSTLKLNMDYFTEVGFGDSRKNSSHLLDEVEGLQLDIENGKVKHFVYLPSSQDDALRCPGNNHILPNYYSSLLNKEEQQQIDEFMSRLTKEPGLKGVIQAESEGRRLTQPPLMFDVVKYIESKYGKDLGRLLIKEGYRQSQRLEFYIQKDGKLIPFP